MLFLPAACGMVMGWVGILLLFWGRLAFGLNFQICLLYFSAWQTRFQNLPDFQNVSGFQNFSNFQNISDFHNFTFLEFLEFADSQKLPKSSELFSF